MDNYNRYANYLDSSNIPSINNLKLKQMTKVKELVERKQIEGSPFMAIKNDNEWFLVCGKYRMTTRSFEHEKEVRDWMELNHWELMATFCSIVAEETTREILKNQTTKN